MLTKGSTKNKGGVPSTFRCLFRGWLVCKDSSNLESLLRSHLVAAPLLGVVGSSPTPLLLLPFLSPTDTHTQKKKKRTQVSSVIVTFQGHPSTQSLLPCRAQFISHKQSSILCRLLSSSLPPTFPSQFFLEGVISQKLKKKKNGVEREEPQMSLAEKDMLQAEYVCSTSKLVC